MGRPERVSSASAGGKRVPRTGIVLGNFEVKRMN
jgi:hypothetical protein